MFGAHRKSGPKESPTISRNENIEIEMTTYRNEQSGNAAPSSVTDGNKPYILDLSACAAVSATAIDDQQPDEESEESDPNIIKDFIIIAGKKLQDANFDGVLNLLKALSFFDKELIVSNKQKIVSLVLQGLEYALKEPHQPKRELNLETVIKFCNQYLDKNEQLSFCLDAFIKTFQSNPAWIRSIREKLKLPITDEVIPEEKITPDVLLISIQLITEMITKLHMLLISYTRLFMANQVILCQVSNTQTFDAQALSLLTDMIIDLEELGEKVQTRIDEGNSIGLITLLPQLTSIPQLRTYYENKCQIVNTDILKTYEKQSQTLNPEEVNALNSEVWSEINSLKLKGDRTELESQKRRELFGKLVRLETHKKHYHSKYWDPLLNENIKVLLNNVRNRRKKQKGHTESVPVTKKNPDLSSLNFNEGLKNPGNDPRGFKSFAWGLVIAVLLGRLPETTDIRLGFYCVLQMALSLKEPTQACFHAWILRRSLGKALEDIAETLALNYDGGNVNEMASLTTLAESSGLTILFTVNKTTLCDGNRIVVKDLTDAQYTVLLSTSIGIFTESGDFILEHVNSELFMKRLNLIDEKDHSLIDYLLTLYTESTINLQKLNNSWVYTLRRADAMILARMLEQDTKGILDTLLVKRTTQQDIPSVRYTRGNRFLRDNTPADPDADGEMYHAARIAKSP